MRAESGQWIPTMNVFNVIIIIVTNDLSITHIYACISTRLTSVDNVTSYPIYHRPLVTYEERKIVVEKVFSPRL